MVDNYVEPLVKPVVAPLRWKISEMEDGYLSVETRSVFGRFEIWRLNKNAEVNVELPWRQAAGTFADELEAMDFAFRQYEQRILSLLVLPQT